MKIKSLTIKNEDLYNSVKEAAIATIIGYGKMYELLHKQLWYKDKLKESGTGYTISTGETVDLIPQRVVTVDYTAQVNGRDVKPIRHWNIKSPSANPYAKNDLQDLGLNQLFMGQKYTNAYDGNLKDGIYHDDCLMQPKATDLTSNDRMGWHIEGNGDWVEKDEWGNIVTTNVYTYHKIVEEPVMIQSTHEAGDMPYYDANGFVVVDPQYTYEAGVSPYYGSDGEYVTTTDANGNIINATTAGGEPQYDSNGAPLGDSAIAVGGELYYNSDGTPKMEQEYIQDTYEAGVTPYYDANGIVQIQDTYEAGVTPYYDANGEIDDADGNPKTTVGGEPKYDSSGNSIMIDATTVGGEPKYDSNGDAVMVPHVNTTDYGWKYVVETPNDSNEYDLKDVWIETENDGHYETPTAQYVSFSSGNDAYPMYTQYIDIPDMSEHGSVEYESEDIAYVRPIGVSSSTAVIFVHQPKSLTRVYTDGTCIQFIAPSLYQYSQEETIYYNNVSGGMKYLPLVYLDTGDLVQNRVDFIDNWDDMFELYVHEDSYWYTPLISIAVIVVSMIIAYYTGIKVVGLEVGSPALTATVMGGAISGIGTVSGDKVFQIVGALVSLGSSVYGSGVKALSTQAMAQGYSERTAAQIASEATFTEVFKGYTSTIGFSNLLNIGSSAYGIYTTATTQEFTQPTDTTTEDDSVSVMVDDDEDGYSDKVMDLIKL